MGVDPDVARRYGGASGASRRRFEEDLKPRLRLTCRTSSVSPQPGTNLALCVLTCAPNRIKMSEWRLVGHGSWVLRHPAAESRAIATREG